MHHHGQQHVLPFLPRNKEQLKLITHSSEQNRMNSQGHQTHTASGYNKTVVALQKGTYQQTNLPITAG